MTERMNIRRLQDAEKSEKGLFDFDPERDITPQDWDSIQHFLLGARQSEAWEPFVETAANVKILKIEKAPRITQEEWQDIVIKSGSLLVASRDWQARLRYAVAMKILKPQNEVLTSRGKGKKEMLGWLDNILENARRSGDDSPHTDSLAYIYSAIKILLPKENIVMSSFTWERMEARVSKLLQRRVWWNAHEIAANLRIIAPDHRLLVSPHDWPSFTAVLQRDRELGDWESFSRHAAQMNILAAKEVHVNERGFELVMYEPDTGSKTQPIPETAEI